MIDISSLLPTIISKLKKLPTGHYLEFMTFKKDRSITIVKIAADKLLVIEKGYGQEEFTISPDKLKKTVKSLIKKEFPRSNKVHLASGEYKGT